MPRNIYVSMAEYQARDVVFDVARRINSLVAIGHRITIYRNDGQTFIFTDRNYQDKILM